MRHNNKIVQKKKCIQVSISQHIIHKSLTIPYSNSP